MVEIDWWNHVFRQRLNMNSDLMADVTHDGETKEYHVEQVAHITEDENTECRSRTTQGSMYRMLVATTRMDRRVIK